MMAPTKDIFSKIRGISKHQKSVKWCRKGTPLIVEREPGNKFDPNAIRLGVMGGTFKKRPRNLGYLSKELAEQLAPYVDRGLSLQVLVTAVTGRRYRRRGVNILISYSTEKKKEIDRGIESERAKQRFKQAEEVKRAAQQREAEACRRRDNRQRKRERRQAFLAMLGSLTKRGCIILYKRVRRLVEICYGIERHENR